MRRMEMARRMDEYLNALKGQLDSLSRESVLDFLELILDARENGSRIFIMGNGGSAATASHFVCDFNKGLGREDEKPFKFICLNDNVPSIMAYANDIGYEEIFIAQLRNLLEPNDVVVGISGSGNSKNVIRAISYAREKGCRTVGLLGYDGGELKKHVDLSVHVNLDNMQIVEDVHMVLDHMGMSILAGMRTETIWQC